MIFTYPDVPTELNESEKRLSTEISGKPYFGQQKVFLSNHVDHLHNREWCVSQANDCNLNQKQNTHLGKLKFETSFNSSCVLLENKVEQLCY